MKIYYRLWNFKQVHILGSAADLLVSLASPYSLFVCYICEIWFMLASFELWGLHYRRNCNGCQCLMWWLLDTLNHTTAICLLSLKSLQLGCMLGLHFNSSLVIWWYYIKFKCQILNRPVCDKLCLMFSELGTPRISPIIFHSWAFTCHCPKLFHLLSRCCFRFILLL